MIICFVDDILHGLIDFAIPGFRESKGIFRLFALFNFLERRIIELDIVEHQRRQRGQPFEDAHILGGEGALILMDARHFQGPNQYFSNADWYSGDGMYSLGCILRNST
jgi:hypothetical protein